MHFLFLSCYPFEYAPGPAAHVANVKSAAVSGIGMLTNRGVAAQKARQTVLAVGNEIIDGFLSASFITCVRLKNLAFPAP